MIERVKDLLLMDSNFEATNVYYCDRYKYVWFECPDFKRLFTLDRFSNLDFLPQLQIKKI